MASIDLARKFAPEISFSKGERYYPCDLFFAGNDIVRNRNEYEALPQNKKEELITCYYHIVESKTHVAYQYWYYYAYNDYSGGWTLGTPDTHDHDMEFAIVYVDKSSGSPLVMALNQHHWLNWVWNPNLEMPIFAKEGGHGMFRVKRNNLPSSWSTLNSSFQTSVTCAGDIPASMINGQSSRVAATGSSIIELRLLLLVGMR